MTDATHLRTDERSCQCYVAIKESLPEPDPLRLRDREALINVVSEIVRGGKPIDTHVIRELAAPFQDRWQESHAAPERRISFRAGRTNSRGQTGRARSPA
jgi:hypothetical protein